MNGDGACNSFDFHSRLDTCSLFDVLRNRRSRRFATGMEIKGPLAYKSEAMPTPLTEDEVAALAFAACGVTGHALADLEFESGRGGTMMGGFVGRTISSADAVHSVAVVVSNDQATSLLRRPQDFAPEVVPTVVKLAKDDLLTELFRKSRVKLADKRLAPPLAMPKNLDVNQWDLYRPGTTYFVPINEYTYMYINGLLEFLNTTMKVFIVDERAGFRPAGLAKFAKSNGGHLEDDPHAHQTLTIERIETLLHSVCMVEQGMILQNLALMAQAMGIGGFPNFAGHEFAWFEALGFKMRAMTTLTYLGASRLTRMLGRLMKRDPVISFPVGLERNGEVLLKPYCPPDYTTMEEAVRAVVERKFGTKGIFRDGILESAWNEPKAIAAASQPICAAAIDATISYCTYIYRKYDRFPAYPAPFRTSVGFQAAHLDLAFYDKFYRAEAISETHREHSNRWH